MAAILNFKIFTGNLAHTLRAISVITFPPGFFLLLIHGIVSSNVVPAIGIIPLFFSSAYSIFLLSNEKPCGCQRSGLSGSPAHLAFDIIHGALLLTVLILTWVFLGNGWRDAVMFGTYCTLFLITNFSVHLYFTCKQLYDAVVPDGSPAPNSCPQCLKSGFPSVGQYGTRNGYAPLLDGEGAPNGEGTAEAAV